MLGIWDVVCEKIDKSNSKRADDLLSRAKCLSGRKTSMISLNANFIISNDQELIECAMSSSDSILKVPERIRDDLEIKRWKNIVKHVYKGLVDFQKRNGVIGNRFECINGWNRVVSLKDIQKNVFYKASTFLRFYLIDDTLWLFTGYGTEYYQSDKYIISLIIMYIIGAHNDGFNPRRIGLYSLYNCTEKVLEVNQIHKRTLESVAQKYIGYYFSPEGDTWKTACGESAERIKELVRYYDVYGVRRYFWINNDYDIETAKEIHDYYSNIIIEQKDNLKGFVKKLDLKDRDSDDAISQIHNLPVELDKYVNEVAFSKSPLIGKIAVYYISDIHLEWHLKDCRDEDELKNLVQAIFPSDLKGKIKNGNGNFIVAFCGDIANTLELSKSFYTMFRNCWELLSGGEIRFFPVLAVLGNHEYSEYNTVEEADKEYKEMFDGIGIMFLNNKQCTAPIGNHFKTTIRVVGGTGFAKYEPYYNCENIIGPKEMSREDEIFESERFAAEYESALANPLTIGTPVIVITHYPLKAWMDKYKETMSKRCLYFNGHNHRNTVMLKDGYHLYANNQVGYKENAKITFKKALFGTIVNPFIQYDDGAYEISSDRYLQFLHYCGENMDSITLIDAQLKRAGSKLYMIKRLGYYGFFIISENATYICVGARYKKASQYTDIQYFYDNFMAIVNRYMIALLPFRMAEEKISAAVKKLGLDGTIHGAIIDLDFYNHIMLNPNGTVTVYYSPIFGVAKKYKSFEKYLESSENKKALQKYEAEKDNQLMVLNLHDGDLSDKGLVGVDTSANSMYGLSRRIRNIERLFTSNVLREWDDSLAIYKSSDRILKQKRIRFSNVFNMYRFGREITNKLDTAAIQLKDDMEFRNGVTDLGTCLWAVAADSSLLKIVPEKYRTVDVCLMGVRIDQHYYSIDYMDRAPNELEPSWNNYTDEEIKEYISLFPEATLKALVNNNETLGIMVDYFGKSRLFSALPRNIVNSKVILQTLPDCYAFIDDFDRTQGVYDEMGLYSPEVVPEDKRSEKFYANTVRLSLRNFAKIPKEFLTSEVYLAAIEKNRTYIKKVPQNMLDDKFLLEAVKRNWRVVKELDMNYISREMIEYIMGSHDYEFNADMRKWVNEFVSKV